MSKSYEPFDNAEEVWFWFCGCLVARGDGPRSTKQDFAGVERDLETVDVHRIIKRMKLNHEVNNRILRVMLKWGELECPPYYDRRAKKSEINLWGIGMSYFAMHLKRKGIIK
ncbi:MAG: hypothetical protein LBL47_01045 [Lactobacillus sp.]|jgi:hypothetical protein|nr:hypothetical protein [Lactobacillus sp.]